MEDPSHGARAAEGVFFQGFFLQIEPEAGLFGERESAVDHAHGREAEPLMPHLFIGADLDAATDFLDQEVPLFGGAADSWAMSSLTRHTSSRYR